MGKTLHAKPTRSRVSVGFIVRRRRGQTIDATQKSAAPRILHVMHRIGISGWTYKGWRGVFYPVGLAQHRELAHASRIFNSIEINGTHYSLQRPSSFQKWHEET